MTNTIRGILQPFEHEKIALRNRFVMAPMTREASPGGVPGADVAEYYRRRAAGGVALIISEGSLVPHPAAGWSASIPTLEGSRAAAGWSKVLDAVHAEGAAMYCQVWHQGSARDDLPITRHPEVRSVSPSGLGMDGSPTGDRLSREEIETLVEAYVQGARFAQDVGFDGIELHGAHGYLLDQFMWERTNRRIDEYADPLRFPTEVIRAVRSAAGQDFPIMYRFSQWKPHHYDVKTAPTPDVLERLLLGLQAAGVDAFHPSTRLFWEPAFPEVDPQMTLAGWTKKFSGLPVVAVGSVGLDRVFMDSPVARAAGVTNLDLLVECFERGDFDLVAVGRALLSEPDWVNKHASGQMAGIEPYHPRFADALL